jgi:hypothetical protein
MTMHARDGRARRGAGARDLARALPVAVTLAFGAAACGPPARPGTGIVGDDVQPRDAAGWDIQPVEFHPDVVDANQLGACGGTRRVLTQSRAEIVLVVDRSGSMAEPGADGTPKWTALRSALRAVLPRVQDTVAAGLMLFPDVVDPNTQDVPSACVVPADLAVAPAFDDASAVLLALDHATPAGATPTADALRAAAAYFDASPDAEGRRYLVLATDGGPNCNPALPRATCRCTGTATQCANPANPYGAYNCLDDARTVATLRDLAARGIHTFVIGLTGSESYADVLNAMAVAGGVPRASSPSYYSAATATQLAAAFGTVTSSVADCRFTLDEAPPDPDMVDVRLGAQSLGRDPRHQNGWDWAEGSMDREIVFYGATCDAVRAAGGGDSLVAAFGCPPGPAPQ